MWIMMKRVKRDTLGKSMASVVVVQHKHPSSTLLSHLNGPTITARLQYKRKSWQPEGALRVTAPTPNKGGAQFNRVCLLRLIGKVGHQVQSMFTRGKAPNAEQFLVESDSEFSSKSKDFSVPRRIAMGLILSGFIFSQASVHNIAVAQSVGFREYIDTFDGYSFQYPQNWIQVRGAGADVFFRDPFVLDENISVDISSPSSSRYKSVEDLGSPEEAGKKVLKQYLTEFMSTRLGVRRESRILSTSSKVASDGKLYYEVEVNIKSYANNNELAVMPQDRVARLEWDRRYLSVLGVENNRLYELRLQTPEKSFAEEENDLREVMDSFRVNKVAA